MRAEDVLLLAQAISSTGDVAGDLDEIPIRIVEIDRFDLPKRTHSWHRPINVDAGAANLDDHVLNRRGCNQAEILGSRLRALRSLLELRADLVEVDLGLSESEHLPPIVGSVDLHAQDMVIEGAGDIDIRHREDDVIDSLEI